MNAALSTYLDGVRHQRPRVWDCQRFVLGALGCFAPETAEWMLARWPGYKSLREGAEEYARRGIDSAEKHCDALVDFSEGRLRRVQVPREGDVAVVCRVRALGAGFPAAGIVTDDAIVFLGDRGGLCHRPLDDASHFLRAG